MAELKARMTIREFVRWLAYSRIEPFGDEWRQSARVAAMVAASNGVRIEEEKLMPIPEREPDAEAVMATMKSIFKRWSKA